jgi:L-fuculose-phosphate aldolase
VAVRDGAPLPAGVSTEWQVHAAAYRARPDVGAVLHLHPQHAVLVDALGERIRLSTTDHAHYVREVRTTPYLPPGTAAVAEAVARQLAGCDVVLMSRHGCVVVGPDERTAYRRAVNLEQAAAATLTALRLGRDLPGLPDLPDLPPDPHDHSRDHGEINVKGHE